MKRKKFLILILIVCSVFSAPRLRKYDTQGNERVQRDISQTLENQAEQGGFFEVCSTEKIVSIVLGLSLLVSLIIIIIIIIIFVCCCKNRKRDPSNEDGYQLVNERDELEKKNDCDEIRKKFNAVGYVVERKWSSIVKDQAKVTLNPDTANPSLAVSPDGSQVRFKGEGSAEWPSVLGRKGFTSGRQYWEVEVGEKGYWTLGVSTHTDEKIIPEKPEEGYWLLRRWKGNTYEAVSQSLVLLTLQHKLYKVGMILDYEKNKLSFYNVYDGCKRYKIHTFTYKFTEVYPIFSPGSHDRGPLKITRFKSGDGNPIFIPVS